MKLNALRSILTVSLTALLTACGGADFPADATTHTAAVVASGAPATAAVKVAVGPMPVAGGQPVPDCQPENCAGLRIIDGNAEAWRYDSQRNFPNS